MKKKYIYIYIYIYEFFSLKNISEKNVTRKIPLPLLISHLSFLKLSYNLKKIIIKKKTKKQIALKYPAHVQM